MVDNIWREVLKSATRNLGHTSCLLFSFNGSNVTQAGEVVNEQSRSCKQVYFFFQKISPTNRAFFVRGEF